MACCTPILAKTASRPSKNSSGEKIAANTELYIAAPGKGSYGGASDLEGVCWYRSVEKADTNGEFLISVGKVARAGAYAVWIFDTDGSTERAWNVIATKPDARTEVFKVEWQEAAKAARPSTEVEKQQASVLAKFKNGLTKEVAKAALIETFKQWGKDNALTLIATGAVCAASIWVPPAAVGCSVGVKASVAALVDLFPTFVEKAADEMVKKGVLTKDERQKLAEALAVLKIAKAAFKILSLKPDAGALEQASALADLVAPSANLATAEWEGLNLGVNWAFGATDTVKILLTVSKAAK